MLARAAAIVVWAPRIGRISDSTACRWSSSTPWPENLTYMTLLAQLVDTSNRVSAASGRTTKVAELAACLRGLAPEEIEISVLLLSGDTVQGRAGIGPSALRAAAAVNCAQAPALSVL